MSEHVTDHSLETWASDLAVRMTRLPFSHSSREVQGLIDAIRASKAEIAQQRLPDNQRQATRQCRQRNLEVVRLNESLWSVSAVDMSVDQSCYPPSITTGALDHPSLCRPSPLDRTNGKSRQTESVRSKALLCPVKRPRTAAVHPLSLLQHLASSAMVLMKR